MPSPPTPTQGEPPPEIRRLYPGLTDHELLELEETWDRYILLVQRIYNRINEDPKA